MRQSKRSCFGNLGLGNNQLHIGSLTMAPGCHPQHPKDAKITQDWTTFRVLSVGPGGVGGRGTRFSSPTGVLGHMGYQGWTPNSQLAAQDIHLKSGGPYWPKLDR